MKPDESARPCWSAFAREVIERAVRKRDSREVEPPAHEAKAYGGVFVTLRKLAKLRACMGTVAPDDALADAVRHAAETAALHDPRFPAVTPAELARITIEVSVLAEPWPMKNLDQLELGRHGVIVQRGVLHGLFLPQVATDHGLDKETFLSRCAAEKAHLPPDAWREPDTEVLLFTTEVFGE